MENKDKIQCHFISNTHWDREWRFSARRTQYMLGYMIDMLLDILDKNPDYRHFHLDSQTMPIQDYLEAYPEKKEKLQKYIKEVVDSKWHLISITDKAEIGKLTYTNPGTLSLELCLP